MMRKYNCFKAKKQDISWNQLNKTS